ncbi:MAG: hypothetical protein FK730_13720 [Asgard group archaeon]|nr:hypothetical protein [Asgard group archaeon]
MNPKKENTEEKAKQKADEEPQEKVTFKTKAKGKTNRFLTWGKYFFMKWRFRLDQARAIFGLVTFAVLLAASYEQKIPWFKDQLFWRGEFLLAFLILIVFMFGGYVYDRIFRLWSETAKVAIERNPYTYAPNPKERLLKMGMDFFMFNSIIQLSKKLDLELTGEETIRELVERYYSLSIEDSNLELNAKEVGELSKKISKLVREIDIENKKNQ